MSQAPAPIEEGLVQGRPETRVTSHRWKLFFQSLVTAGVKSFNGRAGDVVPQAGDYNVAQVTGAVPEAPNDGKLYVRRNGAWEELIIS